MQPARESAATPFRNTQETEGQQVTAVGISAASVALRRAIWRGLLAVITLLALLGSAGEFARLALGFESLLGLVRLFGLGQEANVPTWFSSVILLAAGVLAGLVGALERDRDHMAARRWACLAVLLGLMSLDETATIHETVSARAAYRLLSTQGEVTWVIYYAWIVPGVLICAAAAWWLAPWWRSLEDSVRPRFATAIQLYLGAALGIELAEAAWAGSIGLAQSSVSPFYSLLWTTQEVLEMLGVAWLIRALLDKLALVNAVASLRTAPRPADVQSARLSAG